MKMPADLYQEIKQAFERLVTHFGRENLLAYAKTMTEEAFVWKLWNRVSDDWRDDDNHPRFQNHPGFKAHVRINPHKDRMWSIYNLGLNDSHIETALKRICKELQLCSPCETTT